MGGVTILSHIFMKVKARVEEKLIVCNCITVDIFLKKRRILGLSGINIIYNSRLNRIFTLFVVKNNLN